MDDRPPRLVDRLVPRAWPLAAAAYLAFAAIQPRGGFAAIDVCLFHRATGLPCPSCGLTRSLTDLWHLDPAGAWSWNPLGFVAFPLLLASAALAFAPRRVLERIAAALGARGRSVLWVSAGALVLVFLFGAARAAAVAAGITTFPSGAIDGR